MWTGPKFFVFPGVECIALGMHNDNTLDLFWFHH
jgi:hypothetical protein